MSKAFILAIGTIFLMGSHPARSIPRLVEFRDIRDCSADSLEFLDEQAAAKRREAWAMPRTVRLHFRPGDGALSIESGNAALGYDSNPVLGTNVVDYTLKLITTERGEPLAIWWTVPLSATTLVSSAAMIWPGYMGETNVDWHPSVWIDGHKSDYFVRDWCEWMQSDTRFLLGVLEPSALIRSCIPNHDISQQSPSCDVSKAAAEK